MIEKKIDNAIERYFEINPDSLFEEDYKPIIFIQPRYFFELRVNSNKLHSIDCEHYFYDGFRIFLDKYIDVGFIITSKKSYEELEYKKLKKRFDEMFEEGE